MTRDTATNLNNNDRNKEANLRLVARRIVSLILYPVLSLIVMAIIIF